MLLLSRFLTQEDFSFLIECYLETSLGVIRSSSGVSEEGKLCWKSAVHFLSHIRNEELLLAITFHHERHILDEDKISTPVCEQ